MGGGQGKQTIKENQYLSDDSSFFYKQMVKHTKIMDIENHYALVEKIGTGSCSIVYRSKSLLSGCFCSLKKVDKITKIIGIQQLLLNQFSILRELDHPNIMKLYELLQDQKHYYVVSELIKGRELFQCFKQKKRFGQAQAFQIFFQLVLCLNYLHLNKFMHRDIKLQNMIYDEKSRVIKLIDFGSALQFENKAPQTYKCVDKASYIAPQVIKKHYNFTCDNWSLGVFLHILLTGSPPFPGKDSQEIFQMVTNSQPILNSDAYNDIPEAKQLVLKLLQKSPQKRASIADIFKDPWFRKNRSKRIISQKDHECMLKIFKNLRRFSSLTIAEMQLGVLIFLINFIVEQQNEDSVIRCFHWIDDQCDGVITEKELKLALIEFQDRPQKKASEQAARIMAKIDFNNSKDINYSEFLVAASDISLVVTDATLESAFRVIDTDNSGKLSAQELKNTLGEQISQQYFKKIMIYFDLDKDGEISMHQFKSMMKKLLQ